MQILITGGAGFIGTALSKHLIALGHQVTSLDLRPSSLKLVHSEVVDLTEELPSKLFEEKQAIIHLAGRSIFGKWDEAYKQSIYDSRVLSTKRLFEAIERCANKPQILLSASAIGIYGDRAEEVLDESSSVGESFLAHVVQDWEKEVAQFKQLGLRTLSLRHGHVLGKGGILGVLKPYYKWGIGGPIGKGEYFLSWITLNDLLEMYAQALIDDKAEGVVNAVGGEPVFYKEFSKLIAHAVHRPHVFRIPKAALAFLYSQEFVEEITSSQRVITKAPWVKELLSDTNLHVALDQLFTDF